MTPAHSASGDGRFDRNIGILTAEQHRRLPDTSVAVAGVGGVGGITVERLVRLGIGRVHITDPETFEIQNLNRQVFSSEATIGVSKCEVFERELRAINPDLVIRAWPEGLTEENSAEFCDADVVLDCVEYMLPRFSVHLHDGARKRGRPVVSVQAIGFGSTVMVFSPDGPTFRQWLGYPETTDAGAIQVAPEKFCPTLPAYITMETVAAVLAGEMPSPSTSVGVSTAASLASMATLALLLDLGEPPLVPDYLAFDPYSLLSTAEAEPRFARVRPGSEPEPSIPDPAAAVPKAKNPA